MFDVWIIHDLSKQLYIRDEKMRKSTYTFIPIFLHKIFKTNYPKKWAKNQITRGLDIYFLLT